MPLNFPVPDSNHVKFTQEVVATSKLSYKYPGSSQSFSDVAQNIMSAAHKKASGWEWGWVVGSGYSSDTMGPNGAVTGLQTTLKDKAGCLITVMDD